MFAFVFVAFIAFCSLDYSHAQSFINRFINIGSQSGANQHDIVQNGQWSMLTPHAWQDRLSHNEYPLSKTTDHKMYITLRSDAPDAVNISIKWNSVGGFGSVGDVGYVAGTRVSWDDADWSATVTLQPGDEHWIQFFQATGDAYADNMAPHVTKTGCISPRDVVLDGSTNQPPKPWFDLHVDDEFMRFNMTKECKYPRLAFGTSTGSRLSVKDILSPVNLGDTPNLQSNPSFSLAITPNRPTRQIVMSMETGGGWTSVQGTTYSFQYGSSDNDVRIDTPVMNGDIGVYLVDSGDYTKVVPLMFRSICSQTAIQNNLNQMLSMKVYAGFSSPYVLNIFNVTCGRPSGTEGNWPQLTIQPAPSQQLVGWENSYVYQNNEVGALWHPDGKLVELGRQQQTITFNLNYQPDPRQYSGNIQVNVVTGGSIQGVNGRITRVYNKQTNVDIARNTTYSFPNSGQLALAMDTMCLAEGTMVVDVLLSEVRSQGLVGQYMPIEYRFTWECTMPKFTLSAPNTPDLATNGTGNEGTYGNRVVQKTVTGTGTVTAITTRLNSDMLSDVIYLTLQEPTVSNYKYLFSWQFIPTDTHNINDATVQLQGREISDAAGARDFEFPFQVNQQGDRIQLSVDRFTCTKRGEVRLVTWLRFGFFTRVDLIWIRQCTDVPDQWNDDSSSLSDGAIFGIIVAVLIAVGCCGGIAYNSIKLGKSGLSVIPGVDTFNAWNDGVQGPKRYSTDISKNSKSKVADVEIHSLGYGSYQQSDDGYVDEIDTL